MLQITLWHEPRASVAMTVRQDPAELVARLGHPLEDVRLRALRILRSKVGLQLGSSRKHGKES